MMQQAFKFIPKVIMFRGPVTRKVKGDDELPPKIKKELRKNLDEGSWVVCPYSRTYLNIKEWGDCFYIMDDILINDKKNTVLEDIAYVLGEACAKYGRIHIKSAMDHMGAVRMEVDWGIPNLIWALYPRGFRQAAKASIGLKILSFLSTPLFFLAAPLTKLWQKFVYKRVYKLVFLKYPNFNKEIWRGVQYPGELG